MTIRALAALALLAAAGCGGEESAAPAATDTVAMAKSYRFAPEAVVVDAGTTVTWQNGDNFTHTVEVEGLDGEAHRVAPGETLALAFTRPGTYPYVCTLHPRDMRGTVEVR